MTEQEQEQFESELRKVSPASLPADCQERLQTCKPDLQRVARRNPQKVPGLFDWIGGLRWAVAAPVVIAAILLLAWIQFRPNAATARLESDGSHADKANLVRVDHELVSSYDTVAELPGGEAVRFRCKKWMDGIEMKDSKRGLVIEQRTPRIEVTPVRFETY